MSMEKRGMIGPDTPDLEELAPGQKQAADKRARKTPEELDRQDLAKREADEVKGRLKPESK